MKLRIVLAQLNLLVGDIAGNTDKMINAAKSARDLLKADLIVFPELSITGYPPEDLLLRPAFLDEARAALYEFKNQVRSIYCLIGHPEKTPEGLLNACSMIYNNELLGTYAKACLPNYGVFDEARYFTPKQIPLVLNIHDIPVGIVICEDLWCDGPVKKTKEAGAKIILSLHASPFEIDKHTQRLKVLKKHATENHIPIVYVNCVGGQDELLFDGDSMVVDSEGIVCQNAGLFAENLLAVDFEWHDQQLNISRAPFSVPSQNACIYDALVLGVRDYIHKNHFKGALIGSSGGIDSALTLAIAVDALGPENVTAILMPSEYTADMSNEDAIQLAKNLKIKYEIIPITPTFQAMCESLKNVLAKKTADTTEENLQARIRGMMLMALSNNTGKIVLTTGNRSEMAVGYATLYGDMAGGLSVLKDIPKTLVYTLAKFRNEKKNVIPERIITRPPTAELRHNQKDEDSLPPYDILDKILAYYIDEEMSIEEIIAKGFDAAIVKKIINLLQKNEYKRRQAPPGIRIHHKAFGRDRRYPITSAFDKES
jgi:NAD+ synthase (glutamine-hydrolysing)